MSIIPRPNTLVAPTGSLLKASFRSGKRQRRSAAAVQENGGNGNKDEPREGSGALRGTHQVPLDETGDILCKEQKQTTQQKQADVDKRRPGGLVVPELGELSGKMPPPYLPQTSRPIRPGIAALWGCKPATRRPLGSKVWEVKCQSVGLFSS